MTIPLAWDYQVIVIANPLAIPTAGCAGRYARRDARTGGGRGPLTELADVAGTDAHGRGPVGARCSGHRIGALTIRPSPHRSPCANGSRNDVTEATRSQREDAGGAEADDATIVSQCCRTNGVAMPGDAGWPSRQQHSPAAVYHPVRRRRCRYAAHPRPAAMRDSTVRSENSPAAAHRPPGRTSDGVPLATALPTTTRPVPFAAGQPARTDVDKARSPSRSLVVLEESAP